MFLSDNNSWVHLKILETIYKCNSEHEPSYSSDKYTERAIELFMDCSYGEIWIEWRGRINIGDLDKKF